MEKIIAFFLSVFTFFASFFGWGGVAEITAGKDDFVPVVRFVVSSDSHVKYIGDKACNRLSTMIKTAYSIAEADESYNKLDAVVMVGDLTNKGSKDQYVGFYSAIKSAIKGDTRFIGVVAKSHDCNGMGRDALEYYTSLTGLPTDSHTVINGFHFIGISASKNKDVHYSPEQIEWLDREIAFAVASDPSKPVFVFQHEHIYNTVYGSYPDDGWGMKDFTDVLSKYAQVIDISGHSHYPANDPRAIWQGDFTAINDGGLAYYEFTFEGQHSYHPENSKDMAQCLLVEVNAENSVRVRVLDLTADTVAAEYFIETPSDKTVFTYSQEKRKAEAKAPVFGEEAKLSAAVKGKKVTLAVNPAEAEKDDKVFLYRFNIKNSAGETVVNEAILSDYYYSLTPQAVSFETKVSKGTYTAEVTAEDVWGKESNPLTVQFEINSIC